MKKIVAILDDEPCRLSLMQKALDEELEGYSCVTFDNAPDMIEGLPAILPETVLISLDHDLGPSRQRDGEVFEPGLGRDVADFLEKQTPVCPVIVHTSNGLAAPGMMMVLEIGGWTASRVVPYSVHEWIEDSWITEVLRYLSK